jgi:hypothetical protein
MNASMKLGGFALVVAAVFGGAVAVGSATDSWVPRNGGVEHNAHGATANTPTSRIAVTGAADTPVSGSSEPAAAKADTSATGLTATQGGYTFLPEATSLPSGNNIGVTFRIMGPGGQPITKYETTHDKELHLIAVRRDMAGFRHVHPTLEASGVWHTHLDLSPGPWRLFADFKPADAADDLTLGTDVSVAGGYHPQPLPAPSKTTTVDDYTVTLTGDLSAGSSSKLTLSVARQGTPVTDLQPYLAAYGHLVVLRSDDLAYLHVHPEGTPGDGVTKAGPNVTFYATTPSTGTYRMFLDFQHNAVVRTAEFTVTATDVRPSPTEAAPPLARVGADTADHH